MADFGLGTNPSDFGQLANQYNIAGLDPQVQAEIAQMLQQMEQTKKLGALGVNFGVQSAAAAAPPTPRQTTFKTGPNGERTVTTTMTEDEAIAYQRAMEFQKQALGGFAQQANQIQMQQQQAQGQPWQQLGTALAANMANQPGMPGWVRGLGQTAAQMNPTVDQLRAQYLGTMGQGTQIAGQMVNQNIAMQRTIEDREQRKLTQTTHAETQRQGRVEKSYDNAAESIKVGPGVINPGTIARNLALAGATSEEITERLDQLGTLAANVGKAFNLKRDDVLAAQKLAREQEDRRARIAEKGLGMEQERLRVSEDRMKQAEFLSEKSDYTRNTSLQVGEQQAILTAFNALNLVGKMESLAKTKTIGPISGRVQYMNPYRDAEWQQITNYADQLLLSGLNGKLGAGVSDRDVLLMRSVMPNGKMTQEQFDATTKVMRSLNPDNLVRLMQANPNVQYWRALAPQFEKFGMGKVYQDEMSRMLKTNAENYPNLFGPDRPAIAERTFGAQTKSSAGETTAPGSSSAPSYDEFLKWKETQGKK